MAYIGGIRLPASDDGGVIVFANEPNRPQSNPDRVDSLLDMRASVPGQKGVAFTIKSLFKNYVLPTFVPVINDRRFVDKGLPPAPHFLARKIYIALGLNSGNILIWTGAYNARLFNATFKHVLRTAENRGFYEDANSVVFAASVASTLNLRMTIQYALNDQMRELWLNRWPPGKFKVLVHQGVLHIAMCGHLSRDDNQGTYHLMKALPRIMAVYNQQLAIYRSARASADASAVSASGATVTLQPAPTVAAETGAADDASMLQEAEGAADKDHGFNPTSKQLAVVRVVNAHLSEYTGPGYLELLDYCRRRWPDVAHLIGVDIIL